MTRETPISAVITGLGSITPAGAGRGHLRQPVQEPGTQGVFDPAHYLGKKGLRDLDRSSQLLLSAASIALEDAEFAVTDDNRHDVGVSVGTTFGSLHSISLFDRSSIVDGPRYVNPSLFPNTVVSAPAGRLAIRFGIRGFNATISTGFCAGLDALCHAADLLRAAKARAVLVGSVEDMSEEALLYFQGAGPCGQISAGDSARCPESAVVIVLEEEEAATKRGAPVLGRILGQGKSAGVPITTAGDTSLIDALNASLADAALPPSAVSAVYVASPATAVQRARASDALARCFGSAPRKPAVHAVDSIFGETYSVSGLHAAAAAAWAGRQAGSTEIALLLALDPLGNATSVIFRRSSS